MFSVFISSGDWIRLILGVARVEGGTAGWARSLSSQRFSAVKRYQRLHSGESLIYCVRQRSITFQSGYHAALRPMLPFSAFPFESERVYFGSTVALQGYCIVMYCVYSVHASSKRHRAVNCPGWPSWFASSRSCGDLRPSKSPFYELSLRSHLTDRFERSGQVWSYALCFVNLGKRHTYCNRKLHSTRFEPVNCRVFLIKVKIQLIHAETQTMDAVSWPGANRVYRCCDGWDAERAEQVLYHGF